LTCHQKIPDSFGAVSVQLLGYPLVEAHTRSWPARLIGEIDAAVIEFPRGIPISPLTRPV
jgi:hypothetical protein